MVTQIWNVSKNDVPTLPLSDKLLQIHIVMPELPTRNTYTVFRFFVSIIEGAQTLNPSTSNSIIAQCVLSTLNKLLNTVRVPVPALSLPSFKTGLAASTSPTEPSDGRTTGEGTRKNAYPRMVRSSMQKPVFGKPLGVGILGV